MGPVSGNEVSKGCFLGVSRGVADYFAGLSDPQISFGRRLRNIVTAAVANPQVDRQSDPDDFADDWFLLPAEKVSITVGLTQCLFAEYKTFL